MKQKPVDSLRTYLLQLIASLDDEEGVPEDTYIAISALVNEVYGNAAMEKFCDSVDATDGRFYIREGYGKQVAESVEQASVDDPDKTWLGSYFTKVEKLLDSGSDEGCDGLVVVDKKAFLNAVKEHQRFIGNRYAVGSVDEEGDE